MASSNLDLVRSVYAAWGRGDFSSADWAHPDVEYVVIDGPAPGTWKGLAGMARGARANLDAWRDFRFEAEEYRELDRERVLVLVRRKGRGRISGFDIGEIHDKGLHLFHVRENKVTRFVDYLGRERALADLGLAPEAGSP